MHITELQFSHFRGFEKATLPLGDRRLLVLAGPNGCGKSSVLAAAGSLMSGIAMILVGEPRALFLADDERNIRHGAASGLWRAKLEQGDESLSVASTAGVRRKPRVERAQYGFLSRWAQVIADDANADLTLPVLTHLHSGSTRLVPRLEVPEDKFQGRLTAYLGAFDQETVHFDDFERWFEAEENIENEQRIHKNNLSFQNPRLRAVRGAVRTFLAELRGSDLGDLRVVRAHVNGPLGGVVGRLTVEKGGHPIFLEQLSDGERRLIVLVGDVARRMAVLNPHLDEPAHAHGVLLADEIELHLRPGWQRRVVPALRKAFPGLQLILTTHSPQVLASVDSDAVVLMKDFQFLPQRPRTRGRDTNTLLETVFDVPERPEEVQHELAALYEALQDHAAEARRLYEKLRHDLEEDDPELARIETLLAIEGV